MAVLREAIVSGNNESGTLTLTTSSAPQVGDLLIALHHNDHYTLSHLQEPGGGPWTLHATADAGTNNPHGKAWSREVTTAGVQSVEFRQGLDPGGGGGEDDACQYGWLAVIAGPVLVDDAAGNQDTGTTSQVAPSVTLDSSTGMLLCSWTTAGASDYTVPGSMTGETEIDCGPWSTSVAARENLASTGATGTRTATTTDSGNYAALSVAVGDDSAEPLLLEGTPGATDPAGAPAQAILGVSLTTTPGGATPAGNPAEAILGVSLTAAPGGATPAGGPAQAVLGVSLTAAPGGATPAGGPAEAAYGLAPLTTTPGVTDPAGSPAQAVLGVSLTTTPGAAGPAGGPAEAAYGLRLLSGSPGAASPAGGSAELNLDAALTTTPAAPSPAGVVAGLGFGQQVSAQAGGASPAGSPVRFQLAAVTARALPAAPSPAGGSATLSGVAPEPPGPKEVVTFSIARQLGECARVGLVSTTGGEPDRVCLLVPGAIADDECECGQLAVTVPRIYPSRTFPGEATSDAEQAPCGVPYLAMEVLISIMRCVPGPDSAGRPPTCDELEQAAYIWHEDAQAVREAVSCCLIDMERDSRIVAFVIADSTARGPLGGCVGSELRVTVGIPHCMCPPEADS